MTASESTNLPQLSPSYRELTVFADALGYIISQVVSRETDTARPTGRFGVFDSSRINNPTIGKLLAAITQPILHLSDNKDSQPEDLTPFVIKCELNLRDQPIPTGRLSLIARSIILLREVTANCNETDDLDVDLILHVVDIVAPFYDKYIMLLDNEAQKAYHQMIEDLSKIEDEEDDDEADLPSAGNLVFQALDDMKLDSGNYFSKDNPEHHPSKRFLEQYYEHAILSQWSNVKFGEVRWVRHDYIDDRTSSHSFAASDGELYNLIFNDRRSIVPPFGDRSSAFANLKLPSGRITYCTRTDPRQSYLDGVTGYFRLYKFIELPPLPPIK